MPLDGRGKLPLDLIELPLLDKGRVVGRVQSSGRGRWRMAVH